LRTVLNFQRVLTPRPDFRAAPSGSIRKAANRKRRGNNPASYAAARLVFTGRSAVAANDEQGGDGALDLHGEEVCGLRRFPF
jgi:hypothetical protein